METLIVSSSGFAFKSVKCNLQTMPIRLMQVGPLVDSVLKIAARVEAPTYRDFYESAQTPTIPQDSDEPALTG